MTAPCVSWHGAGTALREVTSNRVGSTLRELAGNRAGTALRGVTIIEVDGNPAADVHSDTGKDDDDSISVCTADAATYGTDADINFRKCHKPAWCMEEERQSEADNPGPPRPGTGPTHTLMFDKRAGKMGRSKHRRRSQ